MAQDCTVSVIIGQQAYSPVGEIRIEQAVNQHYELAAFLPTEALETSKSRLLSLVRNFLDQEIRLEIKPLSLPAGQSVSSSLYFKGQIVQVRVSDAISGNQGLVVKAASKTVLLDDGGKTRSFLNKNLKTVVKEVLQDFPGPENHVINPSFNEEIEYLVQFNESNFNFLQRLAHRYGQWFFHDGKQFFFGKSPDAQTINLQIKKDLNQVQMEMCSSPTQNTVRVYDYKTHKTYESKALLKGFSNLSKAVISNRQQFNPQSEISRYPFRSQQTLDYLNGIKAASDASRTFTCHAGSDVLNLSVGTTFQLVGEDGQPADLEPFIIIALEHEVDANGGYANFFRAIPAANTIPPVIAACYPPEVMQQEATVVDNNDPEGLGRVQVQFKWQAKNEHTPWIRVLQQYGGQEEDLHGFYFIPEINDEVIISFLHNNPELPIVSGSVYRHHSNFHPNEEWASSRNTRKVIRTRSGNQVLFIDEAGKEEIVILNPEPSDPANEIRLQLAGEGKLLIRSKGELNFQAKTIRMDASESITIQSGQNLNLDAGKGLTARSGQGTRWKAKEMNIDSGPAFGLTATDATIKGTTVTVNGTQTRVNGTGKLELKGGALTKLTGTLVKIN